MLTPSRRQCPTLCLNPNPHSLASAPVPQPSSHSATSSVMTCPFAPRLCTSFLMHAGAKPLPPSQDSQIRSHPQFKLVNSRLTLPASSPSSHRLLHIPRLLQRKPHTREIGSSNILYPSDDFSRIPFPSSLQPSPSPESFAHPHLPRPPPNSALPLSDYLLYPALVCPPHYAAVSSLPSNSPPRCLFPTAVPPPSYSITTSAMALHSPSPCAPRLSPSSRTRRRLNLDIYLSVYLYYNLTPSCFTQLVRRHAPNPRHHRLDKPSSLLDSFLRLNVVDFHSLLLPQPLKQLRCIA
ncbi:hypothetical protein R3P38DRAFT_3279340 [Favolaschia claudopus]|uniref:Uncharacterized protein n=1 Tax=Favolaschia claudopus TaxID=2862362 RepID=A0AAW0AJE0_9AGAR